MRKLGLKTSRLQLACAAIASLATCQVANAALTISAVSGGAADGSVKLNFDAPFAAGDTISTANGNVKVSLTGSAVIATPPPQSGVYAPPFLSGNNGIGFGSPDQANGADQTQYLSTGTGSVVLEFSKPQSYIGLLWGSTDRFNKLELFSNGVSVGTVVPGTEQPVPAGVVPDTFGIAGGNQGAAHTYYVNINSTLAFDKVVATSGQNSFEFDNVAIVPEPSTYVAGGLALLPLLFGLRSRLMKK